MHDLIAVGAGEVFEKYWLPAIQKSEKVRLIGLVESRGLRLMHLAKIIPQSPESLFGVTSTERIPVDTTKSAIILVLTPDHYEVVKQVAEMGFKNIVVEKPLVSRDHELPLILELAKERNLKLYAVDMYLPKAFPLAAVLGAVSSDDPRLAFLNFAGNNLAPISAYLGDIEGVSVSVIEGGDHGLPSLDRRQWLEKDPEVGGMLRDLGTHAFAPLVNAGLLGSDAEVCSATLAKFTSDRSGLIPVATKKDVEMYVSTQLAHGGIPIHVALGKLPQKGGEWSLAVRGSKGMFFSSLRSGQPGVVLADNGTVIPIQLVVSPLEFVLEEICMFYGGVLEGLDDLLPLSPEERDELESFFQETDDDSSVFDGNMHAITTALRINEKIRNAYFSSL